MYILSNWLSTSSSYHKCLHVKRQAYHSEGGIISHTVVIPGWKEVEVSREIWREKKSARNHPKDHKRVNSKFDDDFNEELAHSTQRTTKPSATRLEFGLLQS